MSTTESLRPTIVRVYELDEYVQLLKGFRVAACMLTESHQIVNETSVLQRLSALTLGGPSDGNCCSCCGVGPFESREEQIVHYKHHWHTHNLKRKLFGKQPLTLGEFNLRQDDSSSDSEEEDTNKRSSTDLFAAATRHCKAIFTNKKDQVFCVHRCILHHRKEELSTDGNGLAWMERCERLTIPAYMRWAVIMISGGHFAGAVFDGAEPAVHKTMHSYVTRRGQGQAQCNRDQHGNSPKSAGASLRRYNQAQFLEHVQAILVSWTERLNGSAIIFYRAVGSLNQAAMFGKKSPINKNDFRVRVLPFPTRKPSFKEVMRVHETLASIEVYESMELFQKALMDTGKIPSKINSESSIDRAKKAQKTSSNIDRAKSRERTPRELPTQMMSSEDEGPCYIDSETPVGWIRTLSEQASNGVITNSRKDLINDCALTTPVASESESEILPEKTVNLVELTDQVKKKKNKKTDDKLDDKLKRGPQKIPINVKQMWKAIISNEECSLETIMETFEGDLEVACNTQDPTDGNTALHKAAIAAKPEMVMQILNVGGDPCIKNHQLQTPYAASPHQDTRIAFRIFQASHPDKYNYSKSQIPGPVTMEQLEQERERKAQQKRAKRQRDKEKQAAKAKTRNYLLLSDAEKIQAKERRCFLCAHFLPKKPFNYEAYMFCSLFCLQNHRNVRPLNKSA